MEKINQPAVVGEIVAGITLGVLFAALPSSGHFWHYDLEALIPNFTESNETFFHLAEVGVILLLFTSGLHVSVDSIKKTGKVSVLTALGGIIFPFTFGIILGYVLDFTPIASLAAGTIFTATSVGVTARVLMDMDLIRSDVAVAILTTAVIDDILAIIILTVVLAGAGGTSAPVSALILGMLVFFILYLIAGMKTSKTFLKIGEKLGPPKGFVTAALVFCFIISAVAEVVSLAAITGAFLAGVLMSNSKESRFISDDVSNMARLFFIPLFFVSVGLRVDPRAFLEAGPMVLLFIPLAVLGKVIGCGLGSTIGGFRGKDALKIGVGMIPKMEIALVVVTTAASLGAFKRIVDGNLVDIGDQMIAMTVLHVMVTAFLTPVLIRKLFKDADENPQWGG